MYHKTVFHRVPADGAPPNMYGVFVSQSGSGLNAISSQTTAYAHHWAPSRPSPVFQAQVQQVSQPVSPFSSTKPPRTPSILVIDDSQTVRKIVETCLSREGFEVKSFPDGMEAMRWLATPQARIPDLVWLDVELPKLDGYEVARRLKAKPQFRNTVIVMLSRRDGVFDHLKGRLAGAREYIAKPFKTQDIVATTKSLLDVSTQNQETLRQPRIALP